MIGIYKLEINGKVYIGQSRSITKRFAEHSLKLRTGRHYNKHLQRAFDKYKIVVSSVVEECAYADLNKRELYWIRVFAATNPTNGFNMNGGGDSIGTHNPATRAKLRASQSARRAREKVAC